MELFNFIMKKIRKHVGKDFFTKEEEISICIQFILLAFNGRNAYLLQITDFERYRGHPEYLQDIISKYFQLKQLYNENYSNTDININPNKFNSFFMDYYFMEMIDLNNNPFSIFFIIAKSLSIVDVHIYLTSEGILFSMVEIENEEVFFSGEEQNIISDLLGFHCKIDLHNTTNDRLSAGLYLEHKYRKDIVDIIGFFCYKTDIRNIEKASRTLNKIDSIIRERCHELLNHYRIVKFM